MLRSPEASTGSSGSLLLLLPLLLLLLLVSLLLLLVIVPSLAFHGVFVPCLCLENC